MRINWTVIAGVGIVLATPSHGQQNRLEQAATAMGAASLNSIQYRGSGNVYSFGRRITKSYDLPGEPRGSTRRSQCHRIIIT